MELCKDDRVEMPAKPEWGLGRVLQEPVSGKVCVHFREAGEKVLSTQHAKLVRVDAEAARDSWLDNLDCGPAPAGQRYVGPREVRAGFLERYPRGFEDPGFVDEHRAPKLAAHAYACEALGREDCRARLASGDFEELTKRVLKLLGKTNLVYPVEKAALTRALKDEEKRPEFLRVLDDLLYGEDRPDVRFKRYCSALEAIGAARWTLATYFTFIRFPDEHMLLKPTYTQQAAALCRFDLRYKPEPNRTTYGRLLTFARVLGDVVRDLGPRDMFDVQGVIWCVAQDRP
jgi:hypothetical protein